MNKSQSKPNRGFSPEARARGGRASAASNPRDTAGRFVKKIKAAPAAVAA